MVLEQRAVGWEPALSSQVWSMFDMSWDKVLLWPQGGAHAPPELRGSPTSLQQQQRLFKEASCHWGVQAADYKSTPAYGSMQEHMLYSHTCTQTIAHTEEKIHTDSFNVTWASASEPPRLTDESIERKWVFRFLQQKCQTCRLKLLQCESLGFGQKKKLEDVTFTVFDSLNHSS